MNNERGNLEGGRGVLALQGTSCPIVHFHLVYKFVMFS